MGHNIVSSSLAVAHWAGFLTPALLLNSFVNTILCLKTCSRNSEIQILQHIHPSNNQTNRIMSTGGKDTTIPKRRGVRRGGSGSSHWWIWFTYVPMWLWLEISLIIQENSWELVARYSKTLTSFITLNTSLMKTWADGVPNFTLTLSSL